MNTDSHLISEQYDDVVKNTAGLPAVKSKIRVIQQLDKADVDKSHVLVDGVGVFTLGQIKENVAGKFEDLAKRVRNNEPKFAFEKMYERYSVLKRMVETLILAEKDIEYMRRAGQLPGLSKRFF